MCDNGSLLILIIDPPSQWKRPFETPVEKTICVARHPAGLSRTVPNLSSAYTDTTVSSKSGGHPHNYVLRGQDVDHTAEGRQGGSSIRGQLARHMAECLYIQKDEALC